MSADLEVIQDDAGAEEVVVDADEVGQLRVQHHADALLPQSQRLLLRGGQGSVEAENTTHTSSGRQPALTFRMFCVSFHLLVHSLVSSRTCRRPQSHNGTQPHRPSGGWVRGEAGLTLASFWCSFSSMLRAVGESRRAI